MVELLLIEGSEVDVQDNVTGKTALIKAAYGGHFKVVNLLLEAEADPDQILVTTLPVAAEVDLVGKIISQ